MLKSIALAAALAVAATATLAQDAAYLDDRSTPEQLVRSYYNALERGEYGRAVSYFSTTSAPADYAAWWQSFDPADSLELTIGSPHHESRAGWIAYQVPVAIAWHRPGDEIRTERGCVGVFQELPNGEQPFVPMQLTSIQLERQPAGTAAAPPGCDD